jgi:glycine cleavage system protein P-like pyridoxal-binding family|tara:strand:+ start:143 stop:454 length:312 start_codon:yes stop_codon:yes gene_type:complete
MNAKLIELFAKTGITILPVSNLEQKIDIARDYVDLHKEFYIPLGGGDEGLADVFNGIFLCHFGEARLIDSDLGEYELEISSHETKSGNPVLFTFIDPDHNEAL